MSRQPSSVNQLAAAVAAAALVLAPGAATIAQAQTPVGGGARKVGPVQVQPRLKGQLATELSAWQSMSRTVGQINGMQLRPGNLQDLQAVAQRMENLRTADPFAVMVDAAARESSFQQGVQQAAEREGAQKLADRLRANPGSVMQIPGAQAARGRAMAEVNAVSKQFEALSTNLQRAAVAKSGAVAPQLPWSTAHHELGLLGVEPVSAVEPTTTAILVGALVAAAVVIIAAYAEAKAEDFKDREEKKDTRSDFKKCTDRADAKADSCKRAARGDWFKIGVCNAQWAADTAICWTFPQ